MKVVKKILIILSPFIIIGLIIGGFFLTYDIRVEINRNKMENENELFYDLLDQNSIDVEGLSLYEEVLIDDGKYYIIFMEMDSFYYPTEGSIVSGILLEIDTDITTEYLPSFDLEIREEYYILPSLWIAGGGSSIATAQSFYKRAELRRLLIENNNTITVSNITIKIEGSYCLGKLEL